MKKTLIALAIAAVVTAPLGAWAEEKEGKVTKWEKTSRTITFDDGSTYQFNETVKTETMKNVKATSCKSRILVGRSVTSSIVARRRPSDNH